MTKKTDGDTLQWKWQNPQTQWTQPTPTHWWTLHYTHTIKKKHHCPTSLKFLLKIECPTSPKFILKNRMSHFLAVHLEKLNVPLLCSSSWKIKCPTSLKFILKNGMSRFLEVHLEKWNAPPSWSSTLAASRMLHENKQLFTFRHQSVNQDYSRYPQNTLLHYHRCI